MIVEHCKANGCRLEHASDGSIRLFEYKTVVCCRQCGATGDTEAIEERTHVCDVCGEPLDVFEEAVRFSCRGSASQGADEVFIEAHPRCVVNAGNALMKKYVARGMKGIERGARKPKWWDGLRRLLGQRPEPSE